MLKVIVLFALVISSSCFVLNANNREKRTIMIPPQILETLVPVLQKILPEPKLMQIQGLLTKEKLVAEEEKNDEIAVSEDSMVEQLRSEDFPGLAQIQNVYTGFLMQ